MPDCAGWRRTTLILSGDDPRVIEQILDLHIHSRYSRACSKELVLPAIAAACETRGIDIVSTGDWTHPAWFAHMEAELAEDAPGIYALKHHVSRTRFIIGTEIASIKKHAGATRRVHHLVFAPTLAAARKANDALAARGYNIRSDGRPIIGMTSRDLLEFFLGIDERMAMIPAHAWTPWFGVFGSKGGYDSLDECFEDLTPHIRAIETGLSSDPAMNRRCGFLDGITLISNSDAHSPQKLGREANVMRFGDKREISYDEIMRIIREGDAKKFIETLEFYPEEGKYHMDGHADCAFFCTPEETKKYGGRCPKCKKQITVGVMNRVAALADRDDRQARAAGKIPFRSLVPLPEIIADALEIGVATKAVRTAYDALIRACGNEFRILRTASIDEIAGASSPMIAEAVRRVREGRIAIRPGYDGVFGVVKVFEEGEGRGRAKQSLLDLE
ncbi:MAG: endonuclease Q family protein [Candidatus Paceibacterota bacterium]|jgi:uncharacterized protein (TIGR00375 family)